MSDELAAAPEIMRLRHENAALRAENELLREIAEQSYIKHMNSKMQIARLVDAAHTDLRPEEEQTEGGEE